MRKWQAGLGLALAVLAPWAHGAGFDCAKAGTAVEKAICAAPKVSAADGQLGEAFKAALKGHPELADALKLDQRHWLASRDAALSTYSSIKEAESSVLSLYKSRIDFLKGLDAASWPKPYAALRPVLAKLPTSNAKVPADFAKTGVSITLSEDVQLPDAKAFPWQPDATLREALKDMDSYAGYRKLEGSPISSLWSMGGTAHCWTETPFRIEGKQAIAVEAPAAWSGGDCMTDHGMARIAGDIVAYVVGDGSADEVTFETSVWDGKTFAADHMLVFRFDHALSQVASACAPGKSPCDEFATVALTAATRYDRSPQPGTLDTAFASVDKAAYAAQLKAARGANGPLDKDSESPELPLLDDAGGRMTFYSHDAQPFPVVFRGETLLGLIDHGHVGWRENNDWMVSAWRLKAGKLEPVASAYIAVNRAKLLLAAPVPAPPPETH
ncbi:lysozyme inhibitor LprI family protein [Luteibacter aegosomatissinici]|uniref:lysozyme inhibitor LprI family protein n=1 Tax=Luteibacter aegosomatissinici TaxID=2911539 RepID=UPI001FFA2E9B|nr:lysozyme inhibitor LprI family protein [Luteibacter aegosomatissinici]UPG95202.1 lysozyme inhibitor LprI family protein [Luteibacter aegosomatissinici]